MGWDGGIVKKARPSEVRPARDLQVSGVVWSRQLIPSEDEQTTRGDWWVMSGFYSFLSNE